MRQGREGGQAQMRWPARHVGGLWLTVTKDLCRQRRSHSELTKAQGTFLYLGTKTAGAVGGRWWM